MARGGRRSQRTTLDAQIAATARELPARPLVLGGCCCSHVGAVRELARRHGRIGVVWIDAHGDLNTPETSPSGNAWGMPLRMLIDAGDVAAGRRDPARRAQPRPSRGGVHRRRRDPHGARASCPSSVYVALDPDVADPGELDVFMPEPDGLSLETPRGGFWRRCRRRRRRLQRPRALGTQRRRRCARLGHALGL